MKKPREYGKVIREKTMKIEISEESLQFIKQLIETIDAQDNRATASPYFYVIKEEQIQVTPHGWGVEIMYIYDGEWYTETELLDEFDVNNIDEILNNPNYCNDVSKYDVKHKVVTPENHNVFFTEKACHEHLEANHYHFGPKAHSYVRHAWRNPEMKKLFEALREIANTKCIEK